MPTAKFLMLLLAAGFSAGAAGAALAETDPPGLITVVAPRYPDALERRVDAALAGTDATLDQKIAIVEILEAAQSDLSPLRQRLAQADLAMRSAMMTADPAAIEMLRQDRLALLDAQSRRMTRALKDISARLDVSQRQAFFRNWEDRPARFKG